MPSHDPQDEPERNVFEQLDLVYAELHSPGPRPTVEAEIRQYRRSGADNLADYLSESLARAQAEFDDQPSPS
jgi:hypothetical protein